jgi:translocation and assembly module TamB
VPELAPLAGVLGSQLNGSASLAVAVTGTESRPAFTLDLSGSGIRLGSAGANQIDAKASAKPTGALDSPDSRIEFAVQGRIEGIVTPEGVSVPPEVGRDIDWSVAAIAARDGSAVDLTRLAAAGAGLALAGAGQLTEGGQAIEGGVQLSIADLRPFSGLAGHPLSGSIELATDAAREGAAGFKASLRGSAKGLRTGIAAADALLGDTVTITGSLQRNTAGGLVVDQLAIAGAAASLSGDARFDPASNRLAAALALKLPRLKALGAALGSEMVGQLSAHFNAEGALDHLRLKGEVEGSDIASGGARIEHLRLAGGVADLAEPKAVVDGTYRAYGLDGSLALAAEQQGSAELVLPRFRLTAADSAIEGSLRIALDTGLMRGSIAGRMPDLGR